MHCFYMNIGNLHVESPEYNEIITHMNPGQRCLLKGLIRAAAALPSEDNVYHATSTRAISMASKANTLRTTLSKLFNSRPKAGQDDSEDFMPERKRKGKGKGKGKGPLKKKVKEFKFKVVGMKAMLTHTPTGQEKESKTKNIWIRETALSWEIQRMIYDEFNWDSALWCLKYMYVCGRHLRPATLDDVENATSWDVGSLRALMGSGCLYVSRVARSNVDSEDESDSDFHTSGDKV